MSSPERVDSAVNVGFARLGVGLGLLHPAFLGLAAFVGAGLVFAGVTDTCGMGLLLARMPWNRVEGTASPACCAVKPDATTAKEGQP